MNKEEIIILLVEDEPVLQFLFERQLDKLGYSIFRVVDNGLVAVDAVFEQTYHLVFMDVRLLGIDGMTATEQIRQKEKERGNHTNIIGMTAFAGRQRCLDSGMDDFLQKPVLLEQLAQTIEKWSVLTQPEKPNAVSAHHLIKSGDKLDAIQNRIANLRKQVGLS